MELDDGLRMGRRVGVQAADEAELVDVLRRVRQQLGHPGAGLAVAGELELRGRQRAAAGADAGVVVLQPRLVLEGVELRHRSFHEDEDDALGLRREVRLLRQEGAGGACPGLLSEQPGEGDVAEAGTGALEDLTATERVHIGTSCVDVKFQRMLLPSEPAARARRGRRYRIGATISGRRLRLACASGSSLNAGIGTPRTPAPPGRSWPTRHCGRRSSPSRGPHSRTRPGTSSPAGSRPRSVGG